MMNAMRRLALVLCLAVAAPARGQVLHERVLVGDVRCDKGICWREGRAADGATAIVADGEVVPAPAGGPQPAKDEPIYTPANDTASAGPAPSGVTTEPPASDAPPSRRPHVAMDRNTGPEGPGKRVYHEVFNPALFPFKRMTALDAVAADESLAVAEHAQALKPLEVVGADRRTADRDAFWGSVVIDFEPNRWVPLPSAGADARILAWRVEPSIPVVFAQDGADNHYVSSTAGGRHRLIWLTDVPQRYFAGELPATVALRDEPKALLAALPPATRRRARAVLARLGADVRPEVPVARVLSTLVGWFRAFTPGDPPPATGSTYEDLALGQHGSCRHRSYAFVITALAAGIPARYVENELHVFVEAYVPRMGWRRINLGGARVEQELTGGDGKVPYRPKGEDGLPQPPAFTAGGDATPPMPPTLQAAHATSPRPPGSRGAGDAGGSGGRVRARVDLDALDRSPASSAADPRAYAGPTAETRISVAIDQRDAFRGDHIDVSGIVASGDGKPGGLPIEIYLAVAGSGALRVGDAVTDATGRWRATIEVPRDLPLGEHRVVARTPGDPHHRPSRTH
jgi:transglutaminase superfamily protein